MTHDLSLDQCLARRVEVADKEGPHRFSLLRGDELVDSCREVTRSIPRIPSDLRTAQICPLKVFQECCEERQVDEGRIIRHLSVSFWRRYISIRTS